MKYLSKKTSLHSMSYKKKKKRKEKTPPNMSFSLAKAVVDALCLLHSTEKLFVQIITS